jgi:hypothetical protein
MFMTWCFAHRGGIFDQRLSSDDEILMPAKRTAVTRRARRASAGAGVAALAALLLLAGCHGGTLDAIYPGELGHTPPPAVNLPPQDQGMENR